MGRRSEWRRMTSCRDYKKRKLRQRASRLLSGEEAVDVGEKEDSYVEFVEDKTNYGTTLDDDVRDVKRLRADGVLLQVVDQVMKEQILESSKDINNGGSSSKTDISELEVCETEDAPGSNLIKPAKDAINLLPGIRVPATVGEPRPGAIFVFEKASLILAKINKSYQIVNPDEHAGFMKKHKLNRSDYRPDIIHEVLTRLLGSRLNLAGGVQAIYVKTIQGHLIKIEPSLSVPKTLKRFCAMMSQLFQRLSIKGAGRSKGRKLLQMIQNPVTEHLPVGSHKIGLSSTSSFKAANLWEYFDTIGSDHPLVFVIGAMAHGKIDNQYVDDFIAVSALPLSANLCVRRICNALERQRGIL